MNDPFEYRSLLLAIQEKMKNNERLREKFGERIIIIDDPDDPTVDGITAQKPYIGIDDFESTLEFMGSGMFEDNARVRIWIFTQSFPKDLQQAVIGKELGIITLWQLVLNEMCWSAARNNFDGTNYGGPQVVEARYVAASRREKIKNPLRANIFRKNLEIEYQRILTTEMV